MLFSATQTRKVEDLARLSLKKAPLYVGVDDDKETSTADGVEQVRFYCTLSYILLCLTIVFITFFRLYSTKQLVPIFRSGFYN